MSTATTVAVVVLWYMSNIGLLLLNKFLLSNYGFKYPVFLTCLHMISCALMSFIVGVLQVFQRQPIRSRQQLVKITTVATVFCGSLVLGNTSLRFIPVSFNQAVGSTTPVFTAFFAITMTGTYETRAVYMSLIPVVLGIVVASGFEPSFHLFGFAACIGATAARAFKSVLQGILLSDPNEKLDSNNLLMYMAPISVAVLIPMTLVMEPTSMTMAYQYYTTDAYFLLALTANVFLAYFVNLTNFLVTKYTSALTLQVLGNAKGVLAAGVSVAIFRNRLSVLGVAGYGITVLGVALYSETKRRAKLAAARLKSHDLEKLPLIVEAGKPSERAAFQTG